MTSQKQIDANRKNAKKSTGPITPHGKAHTRYNAVTHGFFATPRPIKGENPDAYNALAQRLRLDLNPQSAIAEMLVDQILGNMWRLRRLELVERAHLQIMAESPADTIAREAGIIPIGRIPPENRTKTGPITDEELREEIERWSNDPANEPTPQMRQDFWVKKVLLPGMLPGNRQIAYSTLEQMRRSLVRDIMNQYEGLREIQGESLAMAAEDEAPTARPEEKSTGTPPKEKRAVLPTEVKQNEAPRTVDGSVSEVPDAGHIETTSSGRPRLSSRRVKATPSTS